MAEIREKLILTADNSDLVKGTKEAAASVEEIGQAGQEAGADLGTAMEETHAVLQKVGDEAHEVKSAFSEVATETARMPATVGKDVKEVEAAVAKLGTGVRTTGGEFALAAAAAKKLPDEAMRGAREAQSAVDALGKEAKETGAEAGAAFEKVGDGAKKAAGGTDTLGKSLENVAISIKTMLAGEALGLATQALGTLQAKIEETLRTGIAYNRMLQDSKAGLGALILANFELRDSHGEVLTGQAKLTEAFKQAEDLQKKLAEDAQKTSAEYEDLVQAFQAGLAPAIQAGVKNMDQLRAIMLAASQAAKVLGVEGNQLSQEMTALFRFEKGPDNKLANALQLTSEKLKELKASGQDVGAFLLGQLKPYSDAAAASMDNFSVATSNLNAAIKEAAGELTKPLFEVLSKSAADAQGRVKDVTAQLKGTGQDLATIGKNVEPVVTSVVKLGAALTALGTSAGAALSPVAGYFVTITNAFTALANKLGPGGMELIGRVIATQFGVVIREAAEKAEGAIEKVGMAASHLPEKIEMAASHASETFDKIALAASHGGDAAAQSAVKWSELGDAVSGVSQAGGDMARIHAAYMATLTEDTDRMVAAYQRQLDAVKALRDAERQRAEDAQRFAQESREAMDGISHDYIGVVGQAKVLVLEITAASEEALTALDKLSEKFKDVSEKGRDYAANLLAAYTSGYTDFFTTLTEVSTRIQELNTLLMLNAGNSFADGIRKALEALIDLRTQLTSGQIKKDEKLKV